MNVTPRYWIIDIDHVLWANKRPLPGSQAALNTLKQNGVHIRLLTNDAVSGAATRAARLRGEGFDVADEEVITASALAGEYLAREQFTRPIVVASPAAALDVRISSVTDAHSADCVVVGDIFSYYSETLVRTAAKALARGVPLIAMQRNRWCGPRELGDVDAGFWAAAFEYVAARPAVLVGKPAERAFDLAIRSVGATDFQSGIMVGDDLEVDLEVAAQLGMQTIQISNPAVLSPHKPSWLGGRYSTLLASVTEYYG